MPTINEMVVKLRLAADGVQQGMDTARSVIARGVSDITGQLAKIEEQKRALSEGIRLKFEQSGIAELQAALNDLAIQKKGLADDIRFGFQSPGLAEMKAELAHVLDDIKATEAEFAKPMAFHMDAAGFAEATEHLEWLKARKAELEKEIPLKAKADVSDAKAQITELEKREKAIERDIAVKVSALGVNEANAELAKLDAEARQVVESNKLMQSGVVQAGLAFAGIVAGVRSCVSAYAELSGAQTRLANAMKLTMDATSTQVDEIVKLTEAQAKSGVISATAQQVGAQELATYMHKTESLKQLIPVLNDVAAQQYGFNASSENMRSIATMLGKAFEGEAGSLKRFGYTFDEAQEQALKFGTEAEKVATLMEVIGASVDGVNAALAQTDPGKILSGKTAAEGMAQALGESLAPAIGAAVAGLSKLMGAVAGFAQQNKAATAGFAAFVTASVGAVAAFKLLTAAAGGLNAALAVLSAHPIILLLAGVAAVTVGVITAINNHAQAQKELNKKIEEYNALMGAATTEGNIEQQRAEVARLEELRAAYERLVAARAAEKERRDNGEAGNSAFGRSLGDIPATIQELRDAADALSEYDAELKALGVDMLDFDDLQTDVTTDIEKVGAAIEEAANKLAAFTAHADLTVFFEQTAQAAEDGVNSLSKLDAAIQSVSTGKDLGAGQLLELIKLYPELARYLSETGDAAFASGEVLRRAHENERAQLLETLRAAQTRAAAELSIYNRKRQLTDDEKAQSESLRAELSRLGAALAVIGQSDPARPFPELNRQLAATGDAVFGDIGKLKELSNAAGENLKEWLAAEQKKTQGTITQTEARIETMRAEAAMLRGMGPTYAEAAAGISAAIREAEAALAGAKTRAAAIGGAIGEANGGGKGGGAAYKNDALDSYMKKLDDARALERLNEREYLDGLKYCLSALAKTADERVELEKRIYGQQKSMLADSLAGFERAEREKAQYYGGTLDEMLSAYQAFYDEHAAVMGRDQTQEMLRKMTELERQAEDERVSIQKAALDEDLKMGAISRQAYADGLAALLALYESYGRDSSDLSKQWRQSQRDADDAWLAEAKQAAQGYYAAFSDAGGYQKAVDFALDTRARIIEIYKEYPEKIAPILAEWEELEQSAAEKRSGQAVAIEKQKVDGVIAQYDDLIAYYKNMNGLTVDGAAFSFGAADEAGYVRLELAAVERAIAAYEARLSELTDAERSEYEARLKQRDAFNRKLRNLSVDALKETQKAAEDAAKTRVKAAEDANKMILQGIKDTYAAQIKAAEDAAGAEVSIYEGKIAEIDALMKQASRDEADAGYADKIKRLQEQLAYERDGANRYELQKEIDRLIEEQQRELTKRGYEDQKEGYRAQIAAVKDSLAAQNQALADLRDAEVKAAEERLSVETGLLEAQATARKVAMEASAADLSASLETETAQLTDFYAAKEKRARDSAKNEYDIVTAGMNRVTDYLAAKIRDFANLGYLAGQAWADNFTRMVQSAVSRLNAADGYGSYGGYGGAAAGAASYDITVNQTINSQVASAYEQNRLADELARKMINELSG